ncbi:MAG: cysteine protease [Verrucomicrobiales bacterium]|nr:cysteine protease [Verrucomicrobiales bacterium]
MPEQTRFRTHSLHKAALTVCGLATLATIHASTDYPPAIWNPPCNANYYTSGSGHKFHVIHDIEGYYASTISYFQGCGFTSASVHYLVNGKQDASSDAPAGQITQMIRESNYAWHALCWNQHSTGTEHEGFASNPAWYTPELYDASADLSRSLATQFGYAKDRNHIVAHGQKSVAGWSTWAAANLGIDPNCNTHTDPGPYWDWTGYMAKVNDTGTPSANTVGPDAVSWASDRIDVVVRGGGNSIYHKYWDGNNWFPVSSFQSLAGAASSAPTICSWGDRRLDVFCRGGGNALYHKYYDGSDWLPAGGWENLGGTLSAGVDAVCSTSNRIDVVVRGGNNNIFYKSYVNGTWSSFVNIGGSAASDPTICSWAPGRFDVFYRTTGNTLGHLFYNGTSWGGPSDEGAPTGGLTSGPDAVSWGANRLDIVARGANNHTYHKYYSNGTWFAWQDLGGVSTSDPGISSRGSGRLDVWVRGSDNALKHRWYDGNGWSAIWEDLGGQMQ